MGSRAPLLAACGVSGAIGLVLIGSLGSDDEPRRVRVAHASGAVAVRAPHAGVAAPRGERVAATVVRRSERERASRAGPMVGLVSTPVERAALPAPAGVHDVASDTTPHGCEHGGPGGPLDAVDPDALQGAARDVVRRGPGASVAALREADDDLLPWVAGALLDDVAALCDLDLVAGLTALASDPAADAARRLLALELLGRSPGTDASSVAALQALAAAPDLDPTLRAAVGGALGLLARTREDLVAPARAALLDAAAHAPSGPLRADVLAAVRCDGASPGQVARVAAFLCDPDADVRAAAAQALGGSDARDRAEVTAALELALGREVERAPASVILAAAVLTARGQADALLARMQAAPLVRATPALARQAADYREALAAGETDPQRVLRAHEAREDARLAASSPSG